MLFYKFEELTKTTLGLESKTFTQLNAT